MSAFQLSSELIVSQPILDDDRAGGYVVFEGRVRNHNDGQSVEGLEYEAYESLAILEGNRILAEACSRFEIIDAVAIHRIGALKIGDIAVRIEVAAAHRKAAFDACEFIIDEIKLRVPIWKKEQYATGPTEWLQPEPVQATNVWARQTQLPFVGELGQAKLREAHVLVVGAGGLGCAALPYLRAAGIGRITVVDGDRVEASNLHRQVLYGVEDIGRLKAEVAAESCRRQVPGGQVIPHAERLTAENGLSLLEAVDLVLDATDNFATKFLLNDFCVQRGRPLVQASLHQREGQLMVVNAGPCLRCLWPDAPVDGCVTTCEDSGVIGALPGLFGVWQAAEAIRILLGQPSTAVDHLILLDADTMDMTKLRRTVRTGCPCQTGDWAAQESFEVSASADLSGYAWIDIREREETEALPLPNSVSFPRSELDVALLPQGPILLVCARGIRSANLARQLRAAGRQNVFSLSGGVQILSSRG